MSLISLSVLRLAFLASLLFAAISSQAQTSARQISFDFRNGSLGWQADFADYPPVYNINDFYKLKAELRMLPPELGISGSGFYIQGDNHSADLFMFIKRRLTSADGIVAGQRYQIRYTIHFASNAQNGCVGAGSPPGEGVVLKAGATSNEPSLIFDSTGHLVMNVNTGNQSQDGSAASVAGDIANGLPCGTTPNRYVSVQRVHQHTTEVSATSNGELWLLVGTDSGFEGLTGLYYQRIEVQLIPVDAPAPAVPVLLTDEITGWAVALDSVTMIRDPLPRDTTRNFSQDRRTRVTLFAVNADLMPGEDATVVKAQIENGQNGFYPMTVEYVGKVPNLPWLTQIVVRLPDEVSFWGPRFWVNINMRGAVSNRVPILINQRGTVRP